MFSEFDGRAINTTLIAGAAALGIAYIAGPPVLFWLIAWLLEPRTGVAPNPTFWFVAMVWCGFNAAMMIWDDFNRWLTRRRRDREHIEFMTLRAKFYKSDECCAETLASLRRRAAAQQ